ncbi:hypothetical protein [Donghicola sp. XS_ASV15]|uniref:hypothetical protein n=1 Tax=Donghicola sp. XS_ASV15 TaxID=3241295 RepID=UPI0035148604
MTDSISIRISPSPMRIWLGVAAMMGLGAILIYLALGHTPVTLVLRGFLLVFAGLAIFGGWKMMQSGQLSLILEGDSLTDSAGRVVATIDNIEKVERGAFAFKPSHGFLLHLNEPMPRAWFPGVWWRMGRRVAVGGVLPGGETKAVADMIAVRKSGMEL